MRFASITATVLTVLLASSAWAASGPTDFTKGWSVKPSDGDYLLVRPQMPKTPLIFNGTEPVIEKTEIYADTLVRVIYYSGDYGTSSIIRVFRAVIVDPEHKKILGDFPFRYETPDKDMEQDKLPPQPEWTIDSKAQTLHIKDETSDLNKTISLKSK